MARAPVNQIPLSSMLRPTATPVDTYERPAESSLRGLAESLATFDRSIQTLLETRDKKAEQDAELRGRSAFLKDSDGEIARSITEGKTPAHMSPFYVRGFKNAQGAAAGDSLRTKWQDAWDAWEGKDSEDPEAFDKFFGEFLDQNLGTDDPDVLRGVLPSVEALQQNARTQYTQYRHDQTVNGSLTAHGAVISSTVQDGVDDGLISDAGTNYPAIFSNVDRVVAESLAKGDPGGKAVDTFIDVMSAKILETKDPKLLDWFDQKVPGKDYTYGETPHGLAVKNATVDSLETLARQQAAGITAAQKQAMEKAKDEAQSGIINGILADPNAPFDEKLLTQAEKNGDPLIRLHAKQWRDDLLKGTSDPARLASWYDDVAAGRVRPQQALQHGLANGVFGTAEDIRSAAGFVQSFQTAEDRITKTLDGRVVTTLLSTIRERTSADKDLENPLTGLSDEGLEASADLRQLVTRWVIDNPSATQYEIDEQTTKFGKQILDHMTSAEIGSSAQYNRDPSLPFENPYADAVQPDQTQDSTPSDGQGSADPEVRAWEKANNVTPEQRQKIQDQAVSNGLTYDEFVRERALKASSDAAAKPISYNPAEDYGAGDRTPRPITQDQAESFISQAFEQATQAGMTDDQRTTALLNLIGNGEANGSYNAVAGNPNNSRPLEQFTVDQILGFQEDARRRGLPSTAIGRYQLLHKTLKGLKAEMGLTGNEPFTPELQDRLGIALLNRRGLQAYRAGRISKRTFALSLSKEFAALPHPDTGLSYYHGDGLNRARVARSAVFKALGFSPPDTAATEVSFPQETLPRGKGLGALTFRHAGQEAGIQPKLRSAVEEVGRDMGRDFTVLSGYRSPNHPVERGKRGGGGEHTHGGAMDLDMSGMSEAERGDLVRRLMAKGVKRFITYTRSPNMLHIDLKDQSGNGTPWFMHNKSARNISKAPAWFREIALGLSSET